MTTDIEQEAFFGGVGAGETTSLTESVNHQVGGVFLIADRGQVSVSFSFGLQLVDQFLLQRTS